MLKLLLTRIDVMTLKADVVALTATVAALKAELDEVKAKVDAGAAAPVASVDLTEVTGKLDAILAELQTVPAAQ
jgi:hypothetical protein